MAVPVDPAIDAPYQEAFRDELRALGYEDGKNVTITWSRFSRVR